MATFSTCSRAAMPINTRPKCVANSLPATVNPIYLPEEIRAKPCWQEAQLYETPHVNSRVRTQLYTLLWFITAGFRRHQCTGNHAGGYVCAPSNGPSQTECRRTGE